MSLHGCCCTLPLLALVAFLGCGKSDDPQPVEPEPPPPPPPRAWQAMGSGLPGECLALAVHDGSLIAGGSVPFEPGRPKGFISRWNGVSWTPLNSDFDGPVSCLSSFGGELYAGGSFSEVDGHAVRGIARRTAAGWRPLGSGLTAHPRYTSAAVFCLTPHDGGLLVGGVFGGAGGSFTPNLASWSGGSWSPIRQNGDLLVYALCPWDNGVAVAGKRDSDVLTAPGSRIVHWRESGWLALGSGIEWIPGLTYSPEVSAVCAHAGSLFAGGRFVRAGGSAAGNLARWDGSSWGALQSTAHTDTAMVVDALISFEGELVAAGAFHVGGDPVPVTIARWDGTSWKTLGQGLNGNVGDFLVYQGDLIAAGSFTSSGALPVNHIARWAVVP